MGNHSGESRENSGEVEQNVKGGRQGQRERKAREYRQQNQPEADTDRKKGDRFRSSRPDRGGDSHAERDVETGASHGTRGHRRYRGSKRVDAWSSGDTDSTQRRGDVTGTVTRQDGRSVTFEVRDERLRGTLRKPPDPSGIVVLVSGSCGVAQAPKEIELVDHLFGNGVASLAFDLLTPTEASDRDSRRNIDLLSERLAVVTDWITGREETGELDIGYYGTDTGGPAVLQFVKYSAVPVRAVALYNARPDLSTAVPSVPVFCAVDENKEFLMETNERFYERVKESQARSEFLRAEEGSKVPQQMAHWFGVSFDPERSERSERF